VILDEGIQGALPQPWVDREKPSALPTGPVAAFQSTVERLPRFMVRAVQF
jgi:hypothetical protein